MEAADMWTKSLIKKRPNAPPPPLHVEYSQVYPPFRSMECTTEARFIESLFLLTDDARDHHMLQLATALPDIPHTKNVVRFMNLKLDLHDPKSSSPLALNKKGRPIPPWRQLIAQPFRIITVFTAIGKTSLHLQHRYLTVPQSQIRRDFNNRGEDSKYRQLQPGDMPERQVASVIGALVFIQWEQGQDGRFFFRPHACPFQGMPLVHPRSVQLLREQAPPRRDSESPRPANAFKIDVLLRTSDEDELGHVTNSRYIALFHDVLTFGCHAGYYSNGQGPFTTSVPLSVNAMADDSSTSIAVPVGARFYKDANIQEIYVGYQNELKVRDGVYIWSWVEPERVNGVFDVVQFEICSAGGRRGGGKGERVLSQCRIIMSEYQRTSASAKALL